MYIQKEWHNKNEKNLQMSKITNISHNQSWKGDSWRIKGFYRIVEY